MAVLPVTVDDDPTGYAYGRLPDEDVLDAKPSPVTSIVAEPPAVEPKKSTEQNEQSFFEPSVIMWIVVAVILCIALVAYARYWARYRKYKSLEEKAVV